MAGLRECRARLEALLRGPTQWCVSKSVMWKSEVRKSYYSPVSPFQKGRQRRNTQLIQNLLLYLQAGGDIVCSASGHPVLKGLEC